MHLVEGLGARLYSAVVALVYPARCAACDLVIVEGAAFCELCAQSLEPVGAVVCQRCGLPLAGPGPCGTCLVRPPPYVMARAPFQFGGALARAVRRMKWGGAPELGPPLGRLIDPRLVEAADVDVVVPVPLHPRRLRSREFNQAALLALGLGPRLGPRLPPRLPVDLKALDRLRDTPPQTTLGLEERRRNVREAFLARRERVRGRAVLLVDDVLTTGATVEACTRALLDGGAARVAVLTLARAMP